MTSLDALEPGSEASARPELRRAMGRCRRAFLGTGVFSLVINLLMLTGPLFMLQVYDRVLTSRSVPTLIALTALVAGLYGFMGVLEFIRSRVLSRVGSQLDDDLQMSTAEQNSITWRSKSASVGAMRRAPAGALLISPTRLGQVFIGLFGLHRRSA